MEAKLDRLTERVWVLPFEEERDRPNLSYIRGDRWSLAVDAGHSAEHTALFYRALEAAGLPLADIQIEDSTKEIIAPPQLPSEKGRG